MQRGPGPVPAARESPARRTGYPELAVLPMHQLQSLHVQATAEIAKTRKKTSYA